MAEKVSAEELRRYSIEQLNSELETFRNEYQRCLQQRHSHTIEPDEIKTVRKNITRCTHVLREKELAALVEQFKGRPFVPKQLRPKLNRALRMQLTKKQASARVRRVRTHAAKYPAKLFCFNN